MSIRNAAEELEERRCPPCGTTKSKLRLANYSRNFNHMTRSTTRTVNFIGRRATAATTGNLDRLCRSRWLFYRHRAGWREWTSKGCPRRGECSSTAKRRVTTWSSWGGDSSATAALPRRTTNRWCTPPSKRPPYWCDAELTGTARVQLPLRNDLLGELVFDGRYQDKFLLLVLCQQFGLDAVGNDGPRDVEDAGAVDWPRSAWFREPTQTDVSGSCSQPNLNKKVNHK